MATATNFNTRNDTFRKLMGNGLSYHIPRFQRDYSWTEEEWEDLWLDILGTVRPGGEPAHYMGYLVLQTQDERRFDVIDGQQRLTTLSLLVLAVLKNLQRLVDNGVESENNRRRLEQIRQSYIGFLDPVTLVPRSKLTLNRNNDAYYQTYLVPLTSPLPQRGFRASEHLLRKAFEWFDGRVRELITAEGGDQGVALATFVEAMSDRLFFTVITVTDELNAYKVFETLNARGVRLSATDLLKNYLFSVLDRDPRHPHELESLELRWEALVGRLGAESFPEFLRAHWRSRQSPVRQSELFKTIRSHVSTPEHVFMLMREMEEDLDVYLALTRPENSDWSREWKDLVSSLRLFNVRQPFPLLLLAKRRLDDREFEQVLRATVVVSFRYNVIGDRSPGDQESLYNAVMRRILDSDRITAGEIIAGLAPIYPGDAEFREAFAAKSIRSTVARNPRIIRYILCKMEKHLSGNDIDFESNTLSIEHVFPRNAEHGWEAFPERDPESLAFRLGNMTLLEAGKNRDIGNADYASKREVYAESAFAITREIAEQNDEWTPERIERRQRWMAAQATTLWRIDQLGGAGA
ncbi:MAG: DUF262 domain-containing HNH endonuclease family protein [Thermomicrobiales bacterium]